MATLIPSMGSCVSRMTSGADAIQIVTMKVSKGLEFPVVALPGVRHMPAAGEDEQEAARVFYVAATRATQQFVIGASGVGGFGMRLKEFHLADPDWLRRRERICYELAYSSL